VTFEGVSAGLPRSHDATGWFAVLELCDEVVALFWARFGQKGASRRARRTLSLLGDTHFVHDGSLLLQRHGDRVLVAIAVQPNLVPGVGDHSALFGESLERVAGDEPGGLDVVPLEHLEKSSDTNRSGEEAW